MEWTVKSKDNIILEKININTCLSKIKIKLKNKTYPFYLYLFNKLLSVIFFILLTKRWVHLFVDTCWCSIGNPTPTPHPRLHATAPQASSRVRPVYPWEVGPIRFSGVLPNKLRIRQTGNNFPNQRSSHPHVTLHRRRLRVKVGFTDTIFSFLLFSFLWITRICCFLPKPFILLLVPQCNAVSSLYFPAQLDHFIFPLVISPLFLLLFLLSPAV